MLKRLISPFQKVLLSKKMCPGCSMPLSKATDREAFKRDLEMVTCKCRRMFVYDPKTDTYRRALIEEAQEYSNKRLAPKRPKK